LNSLRGVPSKVRLTAGNYSVHNFYAEVLNLILNVSADLVYPALNNVLSVSTGLGTAGLGLGLGTVGLGLDLGLGRPGLDNITAEIQARRTASTEHGSSAA
jgi:hypothetical protein